MNWSPGRFHAHAAACVKSALVTLGTMTVRREDCTGDKLTELATRLGFGTQASFSPPELRLFDIRYMDHKCRRIENRCGEHPHFPKTSEDGQDEGVSCVALVADIALIPTATNTSASQWTMEGGLDAIANMRFENLAKQSGKTYIRVAKGSGPIVLWLPNELDEIRQRVSRHCMEGAGETAAIQHRLGKGNTDSGNMKIEIYNREMHALRFESKGMSTPEKLCTAIAILECMCSDHWLNDTEFPEVAADGIKHFATYLRTNLLKNERTDVELGIDVPAGFSGGDGWCPRKDLYALLDGFKRQLESDDTGCYADIAFKYKPGKPRQKKRKHDSKAEDATVATAQTKKPAKKPAAKPTTEDTIPNIDGCAGWDDDDEQWQKMDAWAAKKAAELKTKPVPGLPDFTKMEIVGGTEGHAELGHSIYDMTDPRLHEPSLHRQVAELLAPGRYTLPALKAACKNAGVKTSRASKKVLVLRLAFKNSAASASSNVFHAELYDNGLKMEVQEEDKTWRSAKLFRKKSCALDSKGRHSNSIGVVLFFPDQNEYEGLSSTYTISLPGDGALRDGDGDLIVWRIPGGDTRAVRPSDLSAEEFKERRRSVGGFYC
jgi:hypothetical protein